MKSEKLKDRFRHHRFLGRIDKNIRSGIYYSILYGNDIYMNDVFFYSEKKGFLGITDTVVEFLKEKGVSSIFLIRLEGGVPVMKIIEGTKDSKAGSKVVRDDLAGKSAAARPESGPDVLERLSDDTKLKNALGKITRRFRELRDLKAGVIFTDFQHIANAFEAAEPKHDIIRLSLETWRHMKQYSFFIVPSNQLGALEGYGIKDKDDYQESVIRVSWPGMAETAAMMATEAARNGSLLLYPLRSANVMLEERPVPTLSSIKNRIGEMSGGKERLTLAEDMWTMDDVILPADKKRKIENSFRKFIKGSGDKKGFIFHGPPGTGKTSIALALANESGIFYKKTLPSHFKGSYLGTSGQMTAEIFEELGRNAPSILFIDEADAIFGERTGEHADVYQNEIVTGFLGRIEGLKDTDPVFVVLATNHLDRIDSAVRSRLEPLEIPLPDLECRKALVRKYLGGEYVSSAGMMEGLSGRDIKNIGDSVRDGVDVKQAIAEHALGIVTGELRKLGIQIEIPDAGSSGFDSVYGYDREKKRIRGWLKRGDNFILYGPSGTGKTSFTRAAAAYLDAFYISLSVPDMAKGQYGLRDILEVIRPILNTRKVIVNIDEFESIAAPGSSVFRSGFISDLDEFRHDCLILTATTNYLEQTDKAVRRRFRKSLEIGLPDRDVFKMLIETEFPELSHRKDELAELFVTRGCNIDEASSELEDEIYDMEDEK